MYFIEGRNNKSTNKHGGQKKTTDNVCRENP